MKIYGNEFLNGHNEWFYLIKKAYLQSPLKLYSLFTLKRMKCKNIHSTTACKWVLELPP